MGTCENCGNEYDKAFQLVMKGETHTFDSSECAIHALVPTCAHVERASSAMGWRAMACFTAAIIALRRRASNNCATELSSWTTMPYALFDRERQIGDAFATEGGKQALEAGLVDDIPVADEAGGKVLPVGYHVKEIRTPPDNSLTDSRRYVAVIALVAAILRSQNQKAELSLFFCWVRPQPLSHTLGRSDI